MAENSVKLKARAPLGAPGWAVDKGEEFEAPHADALRLIARGLATPAGEHPRATKEQLEAARVVHVETVTAQENTATVRPLQ